VAEHVDGTRTGLLVDFGGVLTTNVFQSFATFCEQEGIPTETVRRAFVEDPRARQLLFDLELGKLEQDVFSAQLGAALGLPGDGLAERLFAGVGPDEKMLAAVAGFRAAGIRTGLISNSWGTALYGDTELTALFDGMVISGEVGLRKPDPEIYRLGADRIGLEPQACVFVDDLGGNLKPARELGMHTIRHATADETIPQLEAVLGVKLA
jgi:putative hydrolase of the HAD superfamily